MPFYKLRQQDCVLSSPYLFNRMKSNLANPSHQEITKRAQQIWQECHNPVGRDTEIWLDAERQLKSGISQSSACPEEPSTLVEQINAMATAENAGGEIISPATSEGKAIKATLQKNEARSPKISHKTAPNFKPAEPGKPLWSKPRSS